MEGYRTRPLLVDRSSGNLVSFLLIKLEELEEEEEGIIILVLKGLGNREEGVRKEGSGSTFNNNDIALR